jgi:hypothetical protein
MLPVCATTVATGVNGRTMMFAMMGDRVPLLPIANPVLTVLTVVLLPDLPWPKAKIVTLSTLL